MREDDDLGCILGPSPVDHIGKLAARQPHPPHAGIGRVGLNPDQPLVTAAVQDITALLQLKAIDLVTP
jgi:hypothetical protein